MPRSFAVVLAAALLIVGGAVHGLYADRWRTSTVLADAVVRLREVPASIDGWVAQEQPTDGNEFAQAGAQGYWARTYRKDTRSILVILMVGRAGRMAVHTPEVCYRGAGFELYGSPSLLTARSLDGAELGCFWSANFVRPAVVKTELQLTWSWSDGSPWSAPANARWTFAGRPALYKLYFSQDVSDVGAEMGAKNRTDFLRAFLPVLNRSLKLNSSDI